MDVRHDDDDLRKLESDPDYTSRLDESLVRAFIEVMVIIRTAPHEGTL